MPGAWLETLSWTALGLAFASTVLILVDVYGRGYRQRMRVMEAVWPVTGLYLGPLAVWGYWRFGRPASPRWPDGHGQRPARIDFRQPGGPR